MEQVEKPKLTKGLMDKSMSLLSFGKLKPVEEEQTTFKSSGEALGEIFKLMVKIEDERKLEREEYSNFQETREEEKERRNKELIKALTGKKKPKAQKEAESKSKTKKAEKETKEADKKKEKAVSEAKETSKKSASKEVPKKAESVAPTVGKVARKGVGTAVKIGIAGITGAAAMSVYGETGATTKEQAMQKGGQIVPNDPSPGFYSYGIFGMNSKAKTADAFAAQYPQLGIKGKSGSKEFNDSWTEVAKKKPKELFDAQIDWYDKNITQPLKKDLSAMLPPDIAKDNRVLAYFSDRRIQYGKTMEKSAVEQSLPSKTPEEFMKKMTDFDLANIGTAFKTYLAEPGHKGAEEGLRKRIERRESLSMSLPAQVETGNKLSNASTENQQLNLAAEKAKQVEQTNTASITNVQNNVTQTPQQDVHDDRPAIVKKSQR